jgi:putative peptidoglycan lipid II flippase
LRKLLAWVGSAKGKGTGFSLLTLGNLVIALITYVRFAEIARIFGTTWETDAFAVALVFPVLVSQVVAHTFGSSFIPIYSRVVHASGIERANRFVSRVLTWIVISGLVIVMMLITQSRELVKITGPGLSPASLDLASGMLRIMLPVLLLSAASGILLAFLTYQKRYGVTSVARIVEIAVSLAVVVLGHGRLGIMVLPMSALVSASVLFLLALVLCTRYRFRFVPVLDPRDRDFASLLRLGAPVVMGTLVGFLGPVVDKLLASFLRESSVTAIDYAARLKNMVTIVFLSPLVTLADITFSREAARGDTKTLQSEISSLLNWTSFVMVPIAGLLTVLAVPVISILFQRGEFTADDSRYVGYALTYYAPWLAQFGIGAVVSRAFYSLKDSLTPVLIGIWGMLANVLLNVILVGSMGIGGLALATTVTSSAKTLMLLHMLRRKLGRIGERGLLAEQARVFGAVIVMSAAILATMRVLPFDTGAALAGRAAFFAAYFGAAAVSFFAFLLLTRSTVLRSAVRRVKDWLARQAP